jgi:hypothetical protein
MALSGVESGQMSQNMSQEQLRQAVNTGGAEWNKRGWYELNDGSAVLPNGQFIRGPTNLLGIAAQKGVAPESEQAEKVIAAGAVYAATVAAPTQDEVDTITAEVTDLNQSVEDFNQQAAAYEAAPTDTAYQALIRQQADLEKKSLRVDQKVAATNWAIEQSNKRIEPVPAIAEAEPVKRQGGMTGFVSDLRNKVSSWENLTPWHEERGETYGSSVKATLTKRNAILAAEVLVPVVYTARNWGKMSSGEKALSIGMDALAIIPVLGAAGKGAREAAAITKLGRVGAAGRAVGEEAARQILWPLEMAKSIQHPVASLQAIRSTGKEMLAGVENIVRPTKLPESVVISTMHSAKLPVSAVASGKEAMAVRDNLMVGLQKIGSGVTVDTAEAAFELHLTPLMKKTGGVAHGATDITLFDVGLVVKEIPNKAQVEQGLFLAPNPIGRYALGSSAMGAVKGEKSGIFIVSKEYAQKLTRSSRKLYRGTAEMESVIDVGRQLEKPAQKLFTRINGERVEIYLASKLSKADILKLKVQGLVEGVKTIYQPTLEIKGAALKGLSSGEIDDLARIVGRSDEGVARNLNRLSEVARARPSSLPSIVLRARYGTQAKARIVTVQTRVESVRRGRAIPRLSTSRMVEEIVPRRGQTIEQAITERVADRTDRAEAEGYRDVARVSREEGPRVEAPRATDRILRAETPRTSRVEGPRMETPRTGSLRVETSRGRASRVEGSRVSGRTPRIESPRLSGERVPVERSRVPREPRPIEPTPRETIPRIRLASGEEVILDRKTLKGATAFKQGWCYWTLLKDGRNIPTIEPIPGVPLETGEGSPQRSLVSFGGGMNTERMLDMGISRARIVDPPGKAKPRISYTPVKKAPRKVAPRLSR